jgi:hypothetical protein
VEARVPLLGLLAVAFRLKFRVQAFVKRTFCLMVKISLQTTSLLWSRPSPVKSRLFGSLLGSALDQAAFLIAYILACKRHASKLALLPP